MSPFLTMLAASVAAVIVLPASVHGQSMPGMDMPGMKMTPAKKPVAKKPAAKPARRAPASRKGAVRRIPRAATPAKRAVPAPVVPFMDQGAMPGMDMSGSKPTTAAPMAPMPGMEAPAGSAPDKPRDAMPGMDMPAMTMTGTALPAGSAPAPVPPHDHYADRFFPANDMGQARALMMTEEGGRNLHQILFNLAEYQVRDGRNGYRWDGEAWFGGDINRLTLKSEGEGTFRQGVDSAEIQALYSRAVGPYFNLQAGVRHDFQPSPTRTYATIGFEGLAPYMFEVEGALFLSQKGDLLGRLEGYYDQRITQRLILQPRVELNLAAQDVPENRIGAGLSNAELGLRLRYEISRKFAPYVGLSYDAKTGRTADYARADGKTPTSTSFVAGVRLRF